MSLFNKAVDLFRRFHDRAPKRGDIITVSFPPAEAIRVGELVALVYKTPEHRKPFFHRFDGKRRPLLFVSADGTQAYVLRGAYRFTSRGFID